MTVYSFCFSLVRKLDAQGSLGFGIFPGGIPGVGGGGTPYNGLHGEAPPEMGTFLGFRYKKG